MITGAFMDKSKVKQEMIRNLRQKAQETLKLCDEVEKGKISAEEFEKRISKIQVYKYL